MRYRPFDGDAWLGREIALDGGPYRILAESKFEVAQEMAYVRQGRKAQVCKLVGPDGDLHALKVFYRGFSLSASASISARLREFGDIDGLRVCRRRLISADEAAAVGEPGLAGAVLMPWIDGVAWAGVVEDRHPLAADTGLAMSVRAAQLLARLEAEGLAHADIASSNVIVTGSADGPALELIDVEDMYHETFGEVPHVPTGSPGYAHPRGNGVSCRNPYGDRFAGAILLTEMLTWHDPAVRESRADTSLFAPAELGWPGPKYERVHSVLRQRSAPLAALLATAWDSPGLIDCPPLAAWAAAVGKLAGSPGRPSEVVRAEIAALVDHPHATHPVAAPSSFPGVPAHEGIAFIPLFDADDPR